MRFDDRLMTVLDQPASDPHDRAVRWRQLVDLVARAGNQTDNPLVEHALSLIRSDRSEVDDALRAAAARAVAALPLPLELVAVFASDALAVSAPVLAAARLERTEWAQLLGQADDETRQFIRTLHPDLPASVPAAPAGEPFVEPPSADEPFVEERPFVDRRVERRRAEDRRSAGASAEAPVEDSPASGDQLSDEPPAEEQPVEEPTEDPVVEEPVVDEPVVEEPPVEEASVEEPVVEEPVVDEPVVEEPIVEEPIVDEPPVEEPVVDEPMIDEPVVEEPPVEVARIDEPVVEEPDIEEAPIEEPVADEPPIGELPFEQSPADQSAVEDDDSIAGASSDEGGNDVAEVEEGDDDQRPVQDPPVDVPFVGWDHRAEQPAPEVTNQPVPSISEVVARIERLRQTRTEPPRIFVPEETRVATAPAGPGLFRWECGPSGEIAWVEGAPRGPLIGRSIARSEEGEGVDQEVARAFAMRAPFRDAQLSLPGEGAAAGTWKISGVPAFEPADGRFAGYRGIALRESGGSYDPARDGHSLLSDPNSLRELVHEIKTPLNAIIGFAEIIDGQLLGPADRQYRSRAAEIVGQARLLLSAIDDLDFAAKLQADRNRPGSGTDLAMLLEQIGAGMRQGASASAPQLELSIETRKRRCALEPALAERLVTRFCTALFGAAADGENLIVHLDNRSGRCALWVRPPPGLDAGDGDTAGAGFGLRLVRGLARIAGGDLTVTRSRISLVLPEL